MRCTFALATLIAIVVHDGPLQAQSKAVMRTITENEATVYSGGDEKKYYPTGKLKKDDRVIVLGQSKQFPGWLEIKPPAGSFSWIKARFVKKEGKYTGVVVADPEAPVPIRPGSALSDKKPNIERWKLKRGTLVVILDEPLHADGSTWLPIDVTPQEVRYIKADAVKGSPVQPVPEDTPSGPASTKTLVAQAERAAKTNNWLKAKHLYLQAAYHAGNYQQKINLFQKLNLIEKKLGPTSSGNQPGHPQHLASNNSPFRVASRSTSKYVTGPGNSGNSGIKTKRTTGAPQWSQWGTLRRTGFTFRGRPMYALVNSKGQTLIYATTLPHLRLSDHVGKTLCMYGTIGYRSDAYMRAHYMTVSYVAFPDSRK